MGSRRRLPFFMKWVRFPGKSSLKDFLALTEDLSPPRGWDGFGVSVAPGGVSGVRI